MTMRRMTFMAGGAVAPIALLALLFNNQWVVDATREDLDPSGGFAALVATFQLPSWRLTAGRYDWSYVLIQDFALLLFFALLAGLVFVGARVLEPGRATLGAVITGWWATTVAAGVSGLIGSLLYMLLSDIPGGRFGRTIVWNYVSSGASYGLLFGWIAGLGALGGFLLSRPRTQGGQQPYGAQPPYGAQQPYAAQQPYGQQPYAAQPPQQAMPQQAMPQQAMPQQATPQQPHPSAVPYVPPQGQPQQPAAWGAAPVPQQPGVPVPQQPGAPQQFGAPPVPPQQPQQPAQEEPAAPEPERPADEDAEPAEPAAEAPETPGTDAPPDTPEDDDLDLADRTIVDRRRDDD